MPSEGNPQVLEDVRKAAGLTVAKMAATLGMTPRTYGRYVGRGVSTPHPGLGATVSWVVATWENGDEAIRGSLTNLLAIAADRGGFKYLLTYLWRSHMRNIP